MHFESTPALSNITLSRNRTSSYTEPFNSTITYPDSSVRVEGFHREYADPTYPLDSPESLRCGRGSQRYAASTETLTVQAGDKVAFATIILPPAFWTAVNFKCEGVCGSPVSSFLLRGWFECVYMMFSNLWKVQLADKEKLNAIGPFPRRPRPGIPFQESERQ
jgi:hypothetical protein